MDERKAICNICDKPAGPHVAGEPIVSHYACMLEAFGLDKGDDYNEAVAVRARQIKEG